MKYYVTTANGYVLTIVHTGTKKDYVELNLDDYDLSGDRLHAYKLGKNQLIFDEKEYQRILSEKQIKQNQAEITELQAKLTETDYIVSRAFEEVMSLTNPLTWVADVIKIMIKYSAKYKEVIANRKSWRERIEELRNGKD